MVAVVVVLIVFGGLFLDFIWNVQHAQPAHPDACVHGTLGCLTCKWDRRREERAL